MEIEASCRFCDHTYKTVIENPKSSLGVNQDHILTVCSSCKSNFISIEELLTLELGDFIVMYPDRYIDGSKLIVYQLVDHLDYANEEGPLIYDLKCISCGMNLPTLTESFTEFIEKLYNDFGVMAILKYDDIKTKQEIKEYIDQTYDLSLRTKCDLDRDYDFWVK